MTPSLLPRSHLHPAPDVILSLSVAVVGMQQLPDLEPPNLPIKPSRNELLTEATKETFILGPLLKLKASRRLVVIICRNPSGER